MCEVKRGQEAWFCGVHSRDYVVISKLKSGWSHLYRAVDSILHTVPFNSSNMISSVIPKFKWLQEAAMVLKHIFSTDTAADKFYFPWNNLIYTLRWEIISPAPISKCLRWAFNGLSGLKVDISAEREHFILPNGPYLCTNLKGHDMPVVKAGLLSACLLPTLPFLPQAASNAI